MELVIIFAGMTIICGAVSVGGVIAHTRGYKNGLNVTMDAIASGTIFGLLAFIGLFFI